MAAAATMSFGFLSICQPWYRFLRSESAAQRTASAQGSKSFCVALIRMSASVDEPSELLCSHFSCQLLDLGRQTPASPRSSGVMGLRESAKDWPSGLGSPAPCTHGKSLQVQVLFVISLVALTVFTLLTSMGLAGQPASSLPGRLARLPGAKKPPPVYSISNETLFEIATAEPNAESEKSQIKEFLEGGYDVSRSLRYAWIRRSRNRQDHYHEFEERERHRPTRRWPTRRGGGSESWSLQLSSPEYAPFWPRFRACLSAWVVNKRQEPKVMQRLVAAIKEPIDRHYAAGAAAAAGGGAAPRKYRTCAVVGNSGILLNRSYGAAIDAHEMVLRLNNARTEGFERHVGARTTAAFMNSNILHQCARRVRCFCQPYGPAVPIVMYISQVQHFMDVAMCEPAHRAPLLVTDPRFDALTARIVKWYSVKEFVEQTGKSVAEWAAAHDGLQGFHYSSGMQAVMLALAVCDEVDLFGFGKSNAIKHHYHTAQRRELKLHDYEAEYSFYDDLVARRLAAVPFLAAAEIPIPPVHVFV